MPIFELDFHTRTEKPNEQHQIDLWFPENSKLKFNKRASVLKSFYKFYVIFQALLLFFNSPHRAGIDFG